MGIKMFVFFLLSSTLCFADNTKDIFLSKLYAPIPGWIEDQVNEDLAPFQNRSISQKELLDYYETQAGDLCLIKFTIHNNQIYTEEKPNDGKKQDYRRQAFEDALKGISAVVTLPDVTFLLSLHDGFGILAPIPVFGMCKRSQDAATILLPDFDALRAKFQVLTGRDLTQYEPQWGKKHPRLIWRGSTAQASLEKGWLIRPDNIDQFSRVILCKLSELYPKLIDAKFTFFAQGAEHIPYLQRFRSPNISYEQLMRYKYQIFIDGNVSPYSASGWKFFSNSLIFKPDSCWFQWYYKALKPYEHYIPVKENLEDLIDKVRWATTHDAEARVIAKNSREFALSHITLPDNWLYLYYVIYQYSRLNFIH